MSAPTKDDGGLASCMSLRDYIAVQAMQALMGDGEHAAALIKALTTSAMSTADGVAKMAYAQADAMLAARST